MEIGFDYFLVKWSYKHGLIDLIAATKHVQLINFIKSELFKEKKSFSLTAPIISFLDLHTHGAKLIVCQLSFSLTACSALSMK